MALPESLTLCHEWKQPQMLLLKYRTILIKLSILWRVKRAKNRKTNIYHYEVNDVVPEIVVKSIGNLIMKHLFFSCFYSRFWKLVFHFLLFSEFKKKKKENESTIFLINIKFCNVYKCLFPFYYTDWF